MVRALLQIVYKEVRGLHQAAYVLALFAFGSQVLALIRDRLLAHTFGAGIELDLYYAAFRIPDLLYVLFASTLSVYVLIPFVADRMSDGGSGAGKRFLSQIFTLFCCAYSALALVVIVLAPYVVPLLFPGFAENTEMLVVLLRILMLQPLFLGISSLLGVITQLNHRFVLYAVSPLIYNVGIIAGLLVFYPALGLPGLVWGVVLGALGHMAIQIPYVARDGLAPGFVTSLRLQEIRGVLAVSVPRALTLSLHQIVLLGLVGFASIMAAGSIAVFQFGFNLQSVPLSIIGVSYSVAAFPLLAQFYAEERFNDFRFHIYSAMRHIIFWSVPAIALFVVIRAQIVRVVLGSGEFDWDDTRLTAAVLALFAISLTAQAIHLLIVRALYAAGNTRLPFFVTLGSSIGILLLALVLTGVYTTVPALQAGFETLMRVGGVPGTEVLMLAVSYTVGMILHASVLMVLAQKYLYFSIRPIYPHLRRSLIAALAAGIAAYGTLNLFVEGIRTETLVGIFLQGLLAGVIGITAAALAYALQRSPELLEVRQSLRRKIFKTDVVAPQDEDHLAV